MSLSKRSSCLGTFISPVMYKKTSADWYSDQTIYPKGTLLLEADTMRIKIGDGVGSYGDLYFAPAYAHKQYDTGHKSGGEIAHRLMYTNATMRSFNKYPETAFIPSQIKAQIVFELGQNANIQMIQMATTSDAWEFKLFDIEFYLDNSLPRNFMRWGETYIPFTSEYGLIKHFIRGGWLSKVYQKSPHLFQHVN